MIQGFFLNRVDAVTTRTAIGRQDYLPRFIGANITQPLLAFVQLALTRAQVALYAPIVERVPVMCCCM